MITYTELTGPYCTISEIAKEIGISRQRLHIIAKTHGVKGTKVADNFTLYSQKDAKELLAIDTCNKKK
jgi:DNA-binding transcriptional MerR regulator